MTPITPEPPFTLRDSDLTSETWARLRKHLTERQTSLRQQLEGDLSESETAKYRGRLAEIKRLLDMAKNT